MTASATQSKVAPRQRRIIERPRLLKLLDETDARTILLLAPAGYGKTTLARQWAKTLNGAAWLTLSSSHRDVAWLAEELATSLDAVVGSHEARSVIRQHVRARNNVQRASRDLGRALAELAASAKITWLVLDDYHEISSSSDSEELIAALLERLPVRALISSRSRPSWASGKRLMYGDAHEIRQNDLAMTADETMEIVGPDAAAAAVVTRLAEGWPAVIGLAARLGRCTFPSATLPAALHRYLAEEIFARASPVLRERLFDAALLGPGSLSADTKDRFGADGAALVVAAAELGFSTSDETFEIHPLIREFLLEKLARQSRAETRVRAAIELHLKRGAWDVAFELILRFELFDFAGAALEAAFKPLVRAGRVQTLSAFAAAIRTAPSVPPPVVDLVVAETSLRDGHLDLARDTAGEIWPEMELNHPLRSRVAAIAGQVAFLEADFEAAEGWFGDALSAASDGLDETEAWRGLATARVFGERPGAGEALAALAAASRRTPEDLLRYVTCDISYRRLGGSEQGLAGGLRLEVARRALSRTDDARARTALAYAAAGSLGIRAEYVDSMDWLNLFFEDARRYGLDFALPYANWVLAQASLGMRRFRDAERALQDVEDAALRNGDTYHLVNAYALRARLLLQTAEIDGAIACVSEVLDMPLIPSWRGEYLSTRALTLACAGANASEVELAAAAADDATAAVDIRLLSMVARTIAQGVPVEMCREIVLRAKRVGTWDPLVCGVRSSKTLASALTDDRETRPIIERLFQRTGDSALAKRAGFRTRSPEHPRSLLSARELEVLNLIARGLTNREISRALYIADSTTKVHVRHILEKLGVRTRAEAVARHERFNDYAVRTAGRGASASTVSTDSKSTRNSEPRAVR